MQPDATPERDTAAQEAWLAVQLQGLPRPEPGPEPSYLTWDNVLVAALGMAYLWFALKVTGLWDAAVWLVRP